MKKITVLGGSGFIGSNLSTLLSKKGYRVTIFDIKKGLSITAEVFFIKTMIS